mmetsp:Transcript_22265/g.87723  ORF Transcript_22265/g.87723 Transcript_22265/m.87723 type:complete len:287 (+) Transcript_22265:1073-1933(+)
MSIQVRERERERDREAVSANERTKFFSLCSSGAVGCLRIAGWCGRGVRGRGREALLLLLLHSRHQFFQRCHERSVRVLLLQLGKVLLDRSPEQLQLHRKVEFRDRTLVCHFPWKRADLVEEGLHGGQVVEDPAVHVLHEGLLLAELDEVGEVLHALAEESERPGRPLAGVLSNEGEKTGVKEGGAEEAEEKEPTDGREADDGDLLGRVFLFHLAADVGKGRPHYGRTAVGRLENTLRYRLGSVAEDTEVLGHVLTLLRLEGVHLCRLCLHLLVGEHEDGREDLCEV